MSLRIITTDTTNSSGNHADLYMDGSLVSVSEINSYAYSSSSANWLIGRRPVDPVYFNGLIDDVRIYNHALSETEVAQIIPEPATALLLGFGAMMLRRKKQ